MKNPGDEHGQSNDRDTCSNHSPRDENDAKASNANPNPSDCGSGPSTHRVTQIDIAMCTHQTSQNLAEHASNDSFMHRHTQDMSSHCSLKEASEHKEWVQKHLRGCPMEDQEPGRGRPEDEEGSFGYRYRDTYGRDHEHDAPPTAWLPFHAAADCEDGQAEEDRLGEA